MSENQFHIQSFIHELSAIPMSDLLVTVPENSTKVLCLPSFSEEINRLPASSELRAIVKTAQQYQKEADVQSLCIVHSLLDWKLKGQLISTPLFLIPVDWKWNKMTNELECTPLLERVELNPYIKRLVTQWTDQVMPDFNTESLTDQVNAFAEFSATTALPATINQRFVLGNFHYHRYHLLRELEGILQSSETSELIDELMGNAVSVPTKKSLPSQLLSPADTDQQTVFSAFEQGNVVIQGPPGTGKSQVLTNLIGKLIATEERVLVVSEKKTALEVIYHKLQDAGLMHVAQVVHSQTSNTSFVQQLKKSWLFLEGYTGYHPHSLQLSEQRLAQLQLICDRLNDSTTVGGISVAEYRELAKETPVNSVQFSTDVPSLKEWLEWKKTVIKLGNSLGDFHHLRQFKPAFFETVNGDVLLNQLQADWDQVKSLLDHGTAEELKLVYQSLGRCQLVMNESFKHYFQLIQKPREWKRFEKNRQALIAITQSLEIASREKSIWKYIPSESQLLSWKVASSFWANRSKNRAIRKMLHDTSVSPSIALESWLNFAQLEKEKEALAHYFESLEMSSDLAHLEIGVAFAKRLQTEDGGLLNQLAQWPLKKLKTVLNFQQEITRVVHQLARYFDVPPTTDISDFLAAKKKDFLQLFPHWNLVKELPLAFFRLAHNGSNWQELQAFLLHSNWQLMEARFPELAKYNGDLLQRQLDALLNEGDEEMKSFAHQLVQIQVARFREADNLLRKPIQKCDTSEKERRAVLRKGKAILVKEFAKQRAHKSIRELLESEAREWIQLMVPVWFATPAQVADHFPLRKGVFDTVIFDEASQLILPNALGALYRSNRAVVAGDEHQMSPKSFFGKQWSGHDLLHQANFYYYRTALKHHYRSTSPSLIAFSNRQFYNNELVVYPQPKAEQVLFRHYCEGAQFVNRRNEQEAAQIAAFLPTLNWDETIGIVAFSEEQLRAIWDNCSPEIQLKITEGQENNRVLFKALEQVQGDEVDRLIISLGYAPNAEDQFHLRFGPLNQTDGYKRLNVLVTRAIKRIDFFTSVKAADFGISANESINLLRNYLLLLEQPYQAAVELQFPYFIQPQLTGSNTCTIQAVYAHLTNAADLLTFHRVMKKRGWDLRYEI
jgi:hypothetical protein